jgi:hypothetical protein
MFYTVYKTTNLINGKFYVGVHKTDNPHDEYLGSGKLLRSAIEKHGVSNFKKEVLFIFDNPEAMFAKEAEIVTAEFLAENNTYNLKAGGFGGWDYANNRVPVEARERFSRAGGNAFKEKLATDPEFAALWREQCSASNLEGRKKNPSRYKTPSWSGRTHTLESKKRTSASMQGKQDGEQNSQFGSMWITDGSSNKKIQKGESIPDGWKPGRKVSRS